MHGRFAPTDGSMRRLPFRRLQRTWPRSAVKVTTCGADAVTRGGQGHERWQDPPASGRPLAGAAAGGRRARLRRSNLALIGVLQPLEDHRRVQAAAVGQHDLLDLAGAACHNPGPAGAHNRGTGLQPAPSQRRPLGCQSCRARWRLGHFTQASRHDGGPLSSPSVQARPIPGDGAPIGPNRSPLACIVLAIWSLGAAARLAANRSLFLGR